jgi:hypothetical protein
MQQFSADLHSDSRGTRLRQITIPKEDFNMIRHQLRDAGMTELVILTWMVLDDDSP